MIDETEDINTISENTDISYQDILLELQDIEKEQTESIQVISDIREQLNFSNTVNTYILVSLLIYGVFKFVSRLLHSAID